MAVLRRSFEGFSDALLVCDGADRVIFSNPRYHRLFSSSPGPDAIQGWPFEHLARMALTQGLLTQLTGTADIDDLLSHRMAERRALVGRRQDELVIGGRWFRRVEERIPATPGGDLPGGAIVTAYSDITDLKDAQAALEQTKAIAEQNAARLSAAVEAIPGGFMMMDEDLNYLIWNRRYAAIGGATDEIIRAHGNARETFRFQARRGDYDHVRIDAAAFTPDQIAATPCLATLIRSQASRRPGERPGEEEMEAMVGWQALRFAPGGRPDGETGETVGTFRNAADGSVVEFRRADVPGVGWVSIYTDITERVRQAEEAAAARQEAEQALAGLRAAQTSLIEAEKLASLGGMVAGIAHELNTPVGITYTAANHLRTELAAFRRLVAENRVRKADLEEFLEMVDESSALLEVNASRASRLVQSFKNVSADQASEDRRTYELRAYLEEIVMSLGPRWKRGGHSVVIDCPDGLLMDSYPGAMGQILTNLIVNSTVHGFTPGRPGRITITVGRGAEEKPDSDGRGDCITLVYQDDGQGIPPAHLSKIYDPFFTTKRGQGSTGLGLNIVYNIATRSLGGRIEVWSAPDQGVRFTLHLPRVAPVPQITPPE
ncbi:MAG: hypothetical protein RLY86_589 [Pseudomonadota bacterium]|jgi:signal transduction histidine kinase